MYMYYEEQYVADLNFGKTHNEYIEALERNRLGDMNFLRIAYLKELNSYNL
jgi:hypothetical protein